MIGNPDWDDLLLVYSLYETDRQGTDIPGDQRYWTAYVRSGRIYFGDFETILLDVLADSELNLRMEFVEVANMEATQDAIEAMQDASKVARMGAQRIVPRLARLAAKSALRYVNGMLLFYDVIAFFDRNDRVIDTYEQSYSPEELLDLYRVTGAVGEQEWFTTTVTSGGEGSSHTYELTVRFGLYGYPTQQLHEYP
jgi:hypothetical protein